MTYKTRYQKTIALSSTEAEFVNASNTGKMILYLRSLLQDIGYPMPQPKALDIENSGTTFMISELAPTQLTRHIYIRYYFAILDWSNKNQLKPATIRMNQNISDSLTKPLGRIKFHQQCELSMGRIPPTYVPSYQRHTVSYMVDRSEYAFTQVHTHMAGTFCSYAT